MSRAATATPPPPYFPARNTTPTMRHCSAPNVNAAHFAPRHTHSGPRRKIKHLPSGLGLRRQAKGSESMDDSFSSDKSGPSVDTSAESTTLSTPTTASVDDESQALGIALESQHVTDPEESPNNKSWVTHFDFGRVAKAVVSKSMASFGDKRKTRPVVTLPVSLPEPQAPVAVGPEFRPIVEVRGPPQEVLEGLPEEEQQARRAEWSDAERQRLTQCAQLCSQWPQSGYHLNKFGPNGARHVYEPQSFSNPQHVAVLMQRQSNLERYLCDRSALYFTCSQRMMDDDDSCDSSLPSPIEGEDAERDAQTAAALRAAMDSSLMSSSQVSLASKPARSVTELDVFSSSLALTRDFDMETDTTSLAPSLASLRDSQELRVTTRPARAQSCGSKRPMTGTAGEEEKRRRVDEAMVVEEAVSTGVIMPPAPSAGVHAVARMCASTPGLGGQSLEPASGACTPHAAVFGHVVKTSDTHPIIISPFFPNELLPILARHLVVPRQWTMPLLLASDIDVPSLLLSYVPPPPGSHADEPAVVRTPTRSTFDLSPMDLSPRWKPSALGNLLLSSCPGKRLRMDGPVKGRGPVCRDLRTDLQRIRSEGVGCLVCCLDDAELALLGVPWDTYREIASECGMDVIRLPMPDGFTPVSISLFDSQVSLIATRYSLRGINVLVHCRGGVGRAGLTACAWAIKMGFVQPHPSLALVEERALEQARTKTQEPSASRERKGTASSLSSSSGGVIKGYKNFIFPHSRSASTPDLSSTRERAADMIGTAADSGAQASATATATATAAVAAAAAARAIPAELEHQLVMSTVERGIAMLRARRGLKAIESFEQVQFLVEYVRWLRAGSMAAQSG